MYYAGASWNGTKWVNAENIGLTLTDNQNLSGYILAENRAGGGFDYSTVTASVYRDEDSYLGWSMNEGSKFNMSKQGLDSLVFLKKTLNSGYLGGTVFSQFHTVDNMTKKKDGTKLDQPYKHPVYGDVQGNTIAPGNFNIEYYSSSGYYGELGKEKNAVMVINNATTISGTIIDNKGNGGNDELRWLVHSLRSSDSTTDTKSYYSDGCFIAPTVAINEMFSYLRSIGLSQGYQIRTTLREINS
jgi:hypothetical protein